MARLRIPKRYLVIRKNDAGTIAIRNSKTGYFTGRIGPQSKSSYTGPGDKTHVVQVKKSIDVNGDGKKEILSMGSVAYFKKVVEDAGNNYQILCLTRLSGLNPLLFYFPIYEQSLHNVPMPNLSLLLIMDLIPYKQMKPIALSSVEQ